ncbi:MAG: polysaccharide deacetylase family protein [Clostridiales Family XIII bacterium]|nr:polysaccharide deacetylase family protein [Clostridiales Family XIII bacterium]
MRKLISMLTLSMMAFALFSGGNTYGKCVPPEPASESEVSPNTAEQAASTSPGGFTADPARPMLALTFDDGPSAHTGRLLDMLEKYEVKATFCVVGYLVDGRSDVVKRASDMGCEVIGHSWDHKQLTKLSNDAIAAQLEKTRAAIEAATGKTSCLYRPPYGALSERVKALSRELGYLMIYWSVDTLDWKTRNADAVYKAVMKGASDRAIILCHDLHKTTVDAMERVIPDLLAQGFQLVTVSELLYHSDKKFEPGQVVYKG